MGGSEDGLEVCINEAWGTVCSAHWTNREANVACGSLGYLSLGLNWLLLYTRERYKYNYIGYIAFVFHIKIFCHIA